GSSVRVPRFCDAVRPPHQLRDDVPGCSPAARTHAAQARRPLPRDRGPQLADPRRHRLRPRRRGRQRSAARQAVRQHGGRPARPARGRVRAGQGAGSRPRGRPRHRPHPPRPRPRRWASRLPVGPDPRPPRRARRGPAPVETGADALPARAVGARPRLGRARGRRRRLVRLRSRAGCRL
ncbi:MAG: hypothetical protein AVDCRST_MAG47-354, partial [uncultured Nocardioidaceae bacterium]